MNKSIKNIKGCGQIVMVAFAVVALIFVYNSMNYGRHAHTGYMKHAVDALPQQYSVVCKGGTPNFIPHTNKTSDPP